MEKCPCGRDLAYAECCEPLINGDQIAKTAEDLMRSRYTAHVKAKVDYIYESTYEAKRKEVDRPGVKSWAEKSEWLGLEIIDTRDGGEQDTTGRVEFVAHYREKGERVRYHEIADFKKQDERWYFVDGHAPRPETVVRQTPKVGRNDPCPCGSGKKYKKCCGR